MGIGSAQNKVGSTLKRSVIQLSLHLRGAIAFPFASFSGVLREAVVVLTEEFILFLSGKGKKENV